MNIDFEKGNGLVPVIVQNALSLEVLMLGYMNQEAFDTTVQSNKVTFFSRSKNRLWTKGEESGNFLELQSYKIDCDADTILVQAIPKGPTCHKGTSSCFGEASSKGFLYQLEATITERIATDDSSSYTNSLYKRGINKMAQKVGEEAVELVIEAKDDNRDFFVNEAADLLYHFLILLYAKGLSLSDIEAILKSRS